MWVLLVAVAGLAVGAGAARPRLRRLADQLATAQWAAEHDALTGLANRRGAQARFGLDEAAGRSVWMVLLDLDGMKTMNDTFGHAAGDELLTAVASRLAATVSAQAGGMAARLGGDEFLLLLPNDDDSEALQAVEAVLEAITEPLILSAGRCGPVPIHPAASIGLAPPALGTDWSSQLRRADIALYHAKYRGHSPVLWQIGMQQPPPRATRGAHAPA